MNSEFILYLIICFALSFLIGIERQYRRRVVGLRTTILVSLGAFLFVTFSFSVGATDLSRIASQVVTGIGFLGAGVILKDGQKIRGLTTAATLWCDAAIGTLCAGGAIPEAILGTILILFSNIILRYINKLINNLSDKKNSLSEYMIIIKISRNQSKELREFIKQQLIDKKITNYNSSIKNTLKEQIITYSFSIYSKQFLVIEKLIDNINDNYNINSIELKKISEVNIQELEEEL